MRFALFILLGICVFHFTVLASSGGIPTRQQTEPVIRKKAPVVDREQQAQERQRIKEERDIMKHRKVIENTKDSLDNTEWKIEVTPVGGGETKEDAVTFVRNQVGFVSLRSKGFSPTNYTLTIQESGQLVWETMQTADDGSIVFIRGEISPDASQMQGIVSYPKEKGTKDYLFKSISKHAIEP